jgi:2-oxo-4-hydroxy-4-carboxy-5-ureidoimidazoline decarboxylase
MRLSLDDLNALSEEGARVQFFNCCASTRWARLMSEQRPFGSLSQMEETAEDIWGSLNREDWLEAFAGHATIGGTPVVPSGAGSTVGDRTSAQSWASNEQSGMNAASPDVRERLAAANRDYEARFGYIFIVCATGKSAEEMLAILEGRLSNAPVVELGIAAAEQGKITRLRLSKLLTTEPEVGGPCRPDL